MYGDIRGSFAEYMSERGTDSQNKEIAQANEAIQYKRREITETFQNGLANLSDDEYYSYEGRYKSRSEWE